MGINEQLIQQFEQSYYSYSNDVRAMLLDLSEEELINKLARDSKMSQMKRWIQLLEFYLSFGLLCFLYEKP